MPAVSIHPARLADLPSLLEIEERCFPLDRMTRRNFHYALTRAKATTLVAGVAGRAVGYALVGYHAATDIARVYSFAVDPDFRGRGVARRLLHEIEAAAAAHGSRRMRLEVRADNHVALGLYLSGSYREFAVYRDYYEDGMTALRLEKQLAEVASR